MDKTILMVFLIISLAFYIYTTIDSVFEKLKFHKKNRVKDGDGSSCHFYNISKHKDTDAISEIICSHPKGKELSSLPQPKDCHLDCKCSLKRNENISYQEAISITSIKKNIFQEFLKVFSYLIALFIAFYKILGG